ncbi:hypothetical protein BV898_09243 [Hypsibius exemplaris]|uniref:G-protein coupled receptors family 1 profile domain-containing protein n=1 Tax=Hypsibius exemplaris TaxID=2072580 RepID=A0A1W0WMX4_HYPEX|nr:hypothetical protein BV898_09243 [Hypsibius exemplaris]
MVFYNNTTLIRPAVARDVNCTLTEGQNKALNSLPMTLSFMIVLCQTFNVVVFMRGPSFIQPIGRLSPTVQLLSKVGAITYGILNRICIMNTLLISVDRWVSVEFAVVYRNNITHRRARIAIALTWLVGLFITVPGNAVYHERVIASCNRPVTVTWKINGTASEPWQGEEDNEMKKTTTLTYVVSVEPRAQTVGELLTGVARQPGQRAVLRPDAVPLPGAYSETRLHMNRRKRRSTMPVGPSQVENGRRLVRTRQTVNVVWSSLSASMVVVLGTVMANIPYNVLEIAGLNDNKAGIALLQVQNSMFAVQYIYTPLAYVIFFPVFREVACKPLQLVAHRLRRLWKPCST